MDAAQSRIRTYKAHITMLKRVLGVKVDYIDRCLSAMMYVEESPPRIEIAPVIDARTYVVALHELGHVVNGHTQPRRGYEDKRYYIEHGVLRCESEAWEWAMKAARPVPAGTWAWGYENGLGSYARSMGAKALPMRFSYRGYPDEAPYDDGGEVFKRVKEAMLSA